MINMGKTKHFPVGTRLILNTERPHYKNVLKDWEKCECGKYITVTGHNDTGWLRFDNVRFTKLGSHWNPACFVEYKESLPEELFTI